MPLIDTHSLLIELLLDCSTLLLLLFCCWLNVENAFTCVSVLQVISSDMKEDHIFRLTGKGADQDPKGVFSINKLTGEVAVSRALDREAIAFYHVSMTAQFC